MNHTDKQRMITKHTVLGQMIIHDCGVNDLIKSTIESIEDHIRENLKRDSDQLEADYMRGIKFRLEEVVNGR